MLLLIFHFVGEDIGVAAQIAKQPKPVRKVIQFFNKVYMLRTGSQTKYSE